jgi:hypothetical protein
MKRRKEEEMEMCSHLVKSNELMDQFKKSRSRFVVMVCILGDVDENMVAESVGLGCLSGPSLLESS